MNNQISKDHIEQVARAMWNEGSDVKQKMVPAWDDLDSIDEGSKKDIRAMAKSAIAAHFRILNATS